MSETHALIIDDNVDNIGVLAELLTFYGITYTQIEDPVEVGAALTAIDKLDVIFLDLEMPGLNGYEVIELLKHDANHKDVPVVAHTVHTNEINNARQIGFHSFLAKPLDADRFSDQLKRILSGEHVWVAS
ncbi:MAG: response regulator [Anaerolineae bacterium]|nr:response regulator [Anaerolineae bacterium]